MQRVLNASVTVEGEVVSRIGRGLLVLIGVGRGESVAPFAFPTQLCLDIGVLGVPGQLGAFLFADPSLRTHWLVPPDDTAEDVKNICQKISSLRIFPDIKAVSDDAPVPDWKASIAQTQGEILCGQSHCSKSEMSTER